MSKWDKFRAKLMGGQSDHNINLAELCEFLRRVGFQGRVEGDHFIFLHDAAAEIINLQPEQGNMAKAYQVRQVRKLLRKYNL